MSYCWRTSFVFRRAESSPRRLKPQGGACRHAFEMEGATCSSRLARRPAVVLLSLVALVSLAYNATWLLSATSIVEMTCRVDYIEIEASMLESRSNGDWEKVSWLIPYLYEFSPHSPMGCSNRQTGLSPWLLPFEALVAHAKFTRVDSSSALRMNRKYFLSICEELDRHLSTPDRPASASWCRRAKLEAAQSTSASDPVLDRSH